MTWIFEQQKNIEDEAISVNSAKTPNDQATLIANLEDGVTKCYEKNDILINCLSKESSSCGQLRSSLLIKQ